MEDMKADRGGRPPAAHRTAFLREREYFARANPKPAKEVNKPWIAPKIIVRRKMSKMSSVDCPAGEEIHRVFRRGESKTHHRAVDDSIEGIIHLASRNRKCCEQPDKLQPFFDHRRKHSHAEEREPQGGRPQIGNPRNSEQEFEKQRKADGGD